jgi:hypothetical protein
MGGLGIDIVRNLTLVAAQAFARWRLEFSTSRSLVGTVMLLHDPRDYSLF